MKIKIILCFAFEDDFSSNHLPLANGVRVCIRPGCVSQPTICIEYQIMNGSLLGQCSCEGGVYLCLIKGLQGTVSGSAWKDKQVECVFVCGTVVRV